MTSDGLLPDSTLFNNHERSSGQLQSFWPSWLWIGYVASDNKTVFACFVDIPNKILPVVVQTERRLISSVQVLDVVEESEVQSLGMWVLFGTIALPTDNHWLWFMMSRSRTNFWQCESFRFPQETVQAEALEELILLMINGELEALKGSINHHKWSHLVRKDWRNRVNIWLFLLAIVDSFI